METPISRRTFLKFASIIGISFYSNSIFAGNLSKNQTSQHPNRIDVHHHILPPEYISALEDVGFPFPSWSPEKSLGFMDGNGIATAITSISTPGVYFGDNAFSRSLTRRCNKYSAQLINDHPKRFGAFAVLPLPDVNEALRESEYALDKLKLDGIILLSNVGGHYLGDPKFDELFKELNHRKATVLIHPTDPSVEHLPKMKLPLPSWLVEFVFDTTRAILNLIFSGTLDRCPDIRFIVSHAGGTAPYLAGRISLLHYKNMLSADWYLKRLYYDIAHSATPYALCSLQELVDPTHILFGSDFPFAPQYLTSSASTLKGLKEYGGFDENALRSIEQENALRLFPRLRKG